MSAADAWSSTYSVTCQPRGRVLVAGADPSVQADLSNQASLPPTQTATLHFVAHSGVRGLSGSYWGDYSYVSIVREH
jgi:hypothetical protein